MPHIGPSVDVRSAGRGLAVEHVGHTPDHVPVRGEVYRVAACTVIQTRKTHLSISHPDRYPTWDEVAAARYALLPRLRDCVMVLPPDDQYANLHPNCFHVHLLRELGPGGRFYNAQSW